VRLMEEDEREPAGSLRRGLIAEGRAVGAAHDGDRGRELTSSRARQAVIPGCAAAARLREARVSTPVPVLTAGYRPVDASA
jgi:hypothetical protein